MGQEIERKFLVAQEKWRLHEKPEGEIFRQGYLLLNPEKTVRVRVTPTTGFLTIKGLTIGATRLEYEYEIPRDEAVELIDRFSVAELSKIRYRVHHGDKVWDVDEFTGENSGLVIAEIELTHEDEPFLLPEWAEREVTGEEKYYNANLTIHPFKKWL